ncbi:hypothetical protein [Streptomyces violascens]|uniref:hypothetical protein n=1 Tax=Streptomyces violascens TaxID=67381 RepID=UPI00369C69B4
MATEGAVCSPRGRPAHAARGAPALSSSVTKNASPPVRRSRCRTSATEGAVLVAAVIKSATSSSRSGPRVKDRSRRSS